MAKLTFNKEINRVRPYKPKLWHDGFFYFTGYYKGNKTYIKAQIFGKDVLNEYYFFNKIEKITNFDGKGFNIPSVYYNKKGVLISYVFFEFLEKARELTYSDRDKVEYIFNSILTLNGNGIILRDLKLSNVMIDEGRVIFIDFTFAKEIDKKNNYYFELKNKRLLYLLGENYKPERFRWDDMYSLLIISKKMKCSKIIIDKIQGEIGKIYCGI
ncbi:TPA: hypothetical protein ACX6RK_003084 [Photobacterium damselae]